MKKLLISVAIFALVLAGCGDGNSENNPNPKTTLTINNMSSYNLLNVEYSTSFGDIESGKDTTKEVSPGTRYVFFSFSINSEHVRCRTASVLTCDENKSNELTITNNTMITTTVDDNTNTLKNIVDRYSQVTTLTIINMSEYDFFNVEYFGVNFGNIEKGKDVTKVVSDGTRYIYFQLRTIHGDVRFWTELISCEKDKNNEIKINNDTIINTTENELNDKLKTLFILLNRPTVLTIINESSFDLTDVIWQTVSFSNTQNINAIARGTNVTKNVQTGVEYIYFRRNTNHIIARTSNLVVVEKYGSEFIFDNNTPIVELNNDSNTGTLGLLERTVIWWDDAEGEMQPYNLRNNAVYYNGSSYSREGFTDEYGWGVYHYYLYPQKNGSRSIAIGGSNTAKLNLKINLERNAKLSFWVANRYRGSTGATFSINGIEMTKWTSDVSWLLVTFDLLLGENDLLWEKKDGFSYVSGNIYYREPLKTIDKKKKK
jgi:hypothetical protein